MIPTMNGTFLVSPAPPGPASPDRAEVGPTLHHQLAAPAPEVLLADSLRRKASGVGRLTPGRRAALVRDHGLALAALAGIDCRELASDRRVGPEWMARVVRRTCKDAGFALGVASDGQG